MTDIINVGYKSDERIDTRDLYSKQSEVARKLQNMAGLVRANFVDNPQIRGNGLGSRRLYDNLAQGLENITSQSVKLSVRVPNSEEISKTITNLFYRLIIYYPGSVHIIFKGYEPVFNSKDLSEPIKKIFFESNIEGYAIQWERLIVFALSLAENGKSIPGSLEGLLQEGIKQGVIER